MPRVLIAEDDVVIRHLVKGVLEREDLEVEEAENGEAAIDKIRSTHFDAILLDFMMPVASGFDVIDWIKANRPDITRSCVIVMTAAVHHLQHFEAERVYAVVKKPFDVVDLLDVVRKCVNDSASNRQAV